MLTTVVTLGWNLLVIIVGCEEVRLESKLVNSVGNGLGNDFINLP